ncbi:MAG TPA: BTAD domain-containing putative transcriptional regulator [Roseiflexaceae bacterium]|nr:BTAD domain-containing putative transcriptional regulator [Roseiflexaceae bacterium]
MLLDLAHSTMLPVCWYTLDSYDADPWEFLRYLSAAVAPHFPQAVEQTRRLFDNQSQTPFSTAAAGLVRELEAIKSEFLLCFDDWHLVDSVKEINDLVTQIAMRCPDIHVILASRSHPTLSNQMLLTARRQFSSIDESQLRFQADEIAAVLAAEGSDRVTDEQAETLVKLSDGWIAGVLLAFQMAGGDIDMVLTNNTTLTRPVQQFLTEQILASQPHDIQQFLYETSLLNELTAEQCDRLLGRSDSARMLERLLAQRLFISELQPGALRYHHLFRECLRQQLRAQNPQRFRALGQKIAQVYVEGGQWAAAFELCASLDDERLAQQILREHGEDLYLQGRLETLDRAFAIVAAAPPDVPLLCLQAKVALDRGQLDQAQTLVNQAMRIDTWIGPELKLLQAVLDRINGRFELASELAEQVLQDTDDPKLQGAALRTLGIVQQRTGDPQTAIATLKRASALEEARGATLVVAQVEHELMVCYHQIGDLYAAQAVGRQAEARWLEVGNLGRRALTRNSLALNQAMRGRYREAHQIACAALRDAQDAATPQYEVAVLSTLGDIFADLDLWERAQGIYQHALRIGGTAFIRGHIAVAQAAVLVGQGREREAQAALKELPDKVAQTHSVAILLLQARIAGATGNARCGLAHARQALVALGPQGSLIEQIRGWMVAAQLSHLANPDDDTEALACLQRAAELSEQSRSAAAVAFCRPILPLLERLQDRFDPARTWLRQCRYMQEVAELLRHQPVPGFTPPPEPLAAPVEAAPPAEPPPVVPEPAAPAVVPDARMLLVAHYLGGDQVWLNHEPVAMGRGRVRAVLAYLITHPRGASRAELYRAIWGEDEPPEGTNALNQVIYRLRALLPENAITTLNRDSYCLDRSILHIEVDTEQFEQLLNAGLAEPDIQRRLEIIWRVLDLYKGPLLGDSENGWCSELRARLERRYQQALRQAAEDCEKTNELVKALNLYHRITARDVTCVAAYAGIMRCCIAMDEPALAIAQYRSLKQALNDELGIDLDPSAEPEQIYQTLISA